MSAPSPAGPATHYELFAGLRDAGVTYLATGAVALVLHGVPRLTGDVDLAVAPDATNLARLERLLAAWGYGEAALEAGADGVPIRRFRHPASALAEIDAVLPSATAFEDLRVRAAGAHLVDLEIPLVGADDLLALCEARGTETGIADAAGLRLLAALRAGGDAVGDETRSEQVRKFSRWSAAARLDWLLAAARLAKGLSPEARPLTRGLKRRHWYPNR
ncbi:MAG TPA: hypothetical protein VI078_05255 [bacterium]